jgi:acyl carrier protein
MKARTALDALAEALAFDGGPGGDANVFIADVNWSAARSHLPLLNAPAYGGLTAGDAAADTASENGAVDLRELVSRLGADQARRAVVDILVEEVARVLRLPRDEVSRTKPLAEIGLDSLMAVELTLSLERRFTMDTPLSASAGASNVVDLAATILSTGRQGEESFEIAAGLAKRHLEKADWGDIAPLMTALQEKGVDLTGASGRQSASA